MFPGLFQPSFCPSVFDVFEKIILFSKTKNIVFLFYHSRKNASVNLLEKFFNLLEKHRFFDVLLTQKKELIFYLFFIFLCENYHFVLF